MKPEKRTKENVKYKNYSGLPVEMHFLKPSIQVRIVWDFTTLLRIKQGEKR